MEQLRAHLKDVDKRFDTPRVKLFFITDEEVYKSRHQSISRISCYNFLIDCRRSNYRSDETKGRRRNATHW